jgi:hypothetical protein
MSELQWMTSLRAAGALNAPAVIPTTEGRGSSFGDEFVDVTCAIANRYVHTHG